MLMKTLEKEQQIVASLNMNQLEYLYKDFVGGTGAVLDFPFFHKINALFTSRKKAVNGDFTFLEIQIIMAVLTNKNETKMNENQIRARLCMIFNRTENSVKSLQYRVKQKMKLNNYSLAEAYEEIYHSTRHNKHNKKVLASDTLPEDLQAPIKKLVDECIVNEMFEKNVKKSFIVEVTIKKIG